MAGLARLLGIVAAIVIIVGGIVGIVDFLNKRADIIYGTEPPVEVLTTASCQVHVKNVGESTGSYILTVTSNNFILSGVDPKPQYERDNELIFSKYALMSGEDQYLTFTISINENLPETASYTIQLDRYTWLRNPLGQTCNYTFDGEKYVYQRA